MGSQNSADIVALDEERSRRGGLALPLDDAGKMLRAAREEAGLSLADVADAINVKEDRLRAIEAMDLERLPSAPYTMGFVRAYADHLGLPVEPLVARYREEAGYARTVTAPKIAPPPKDLAAGREVQLVGVLLVVGFVLWCVWQIVQALAPEEQAALPSGFPIADRTEEARVEYEVATSLEEELRRAPPAVVTEGGAGADGASETPEAGRASGGDQVPASASADAASSALADGFADGPSLLPRVLAPPTRPAPARPAPRAADVSPPAGSDAGSDVGSDMGRVRAADLNERLLLEAMAGSAPQRREAAEDGTDAPARALAPDAGPVTARAAPTARAPVQTVSLPTEPDAAPLGARPVTARPSAPSPSAPRPAAPRRAAPSEPVRLVEETPARLVQPVPPVYPTRCESRARVEETVTVRFAVSRFGKVTGPSVASSSNGCFDRAALAAVARFAFEPATRDGRPVPEGDRTTRVVFRKP